MRDNDFYIGLAVGAVLAVVVLFWMTIQTVELEHCAKDGRVTICRPYNGKLPNVPLKDGGFVRVRR